MEYNKTSAVSLRSIKEDMVLYTVYKSHLQFYDAKFFSQKQIQLLQKKEVETRQFLERSFHAESERHQKHMSRFEVSLKTDRLEPLLKKKSEIMRSDSIYKLQKRSQSRGV